jgi:hypothetical protein
MANARMARLSTGFEVPLDGDLLAIIEALYREITLGNVLQSSFETMRTEILSVIEQMTPDERRDYLAESLFLNSVTYENEMLSAYVRKLGAQVPAPVARKKARASKKPNPRKAPRKRVGKKKVAKKKRR